MSAAKRHAKEKPFSFDEERLRRDAKKVMDNPEIMAAIRKAQAAIESSS